MFFRYILAPAQLIEQHFETHPWVMELGAMLFYAIEKSHNALCSPIVLCSSTLMTVTHFYCAGWCFKQRCRELFCPSGKEGSIALTGVYHPETVGALNQVQHCKKECLAIQWEVDFLHYYLLGRPFTHCSDHAPVQWLHHMKDTNAWLTQCFNVVHRLAGLGGSRVGWMAPHL